MQKKCAKCLVGKDIEDFFEKKSEKRRTSWCRSCLYEYQHLRWIARKKKSVQLLGGECCRCGYKKNLAALHFHHLFDKDMEWSSVNRWRWQRIVEELKKCILLCANCHAEEHNPNYFVEHPKNDNPSLNKIISPTGVCLVCNMEVYGTIYCSQDCARIGRRKVKRPDVFHLKKDLETMSWVAIGKKYGVSDNSIRKWAKYYELRL